MSKLTAKEIAREYCEKYPSGTNASVSRRLFKDHSERFTTLNAAALAVRRARGQQGAKNRKYATDPKEKKPSGWVPSCPPTSAEPWLPVELGPGRVLSLSDIHIPYHCPEAVESAVSFGRTLKPDTVLLNGDTADFYRISRFQHDPKKRTLAEEVALVREFLAWLRGQFKDSRIIYKLGNHDARWNSYIWAKAPELVGIDQAEIHQALHFADYGIERVDDNPIYAGDLIILHGHELGGGAYSPVSAARTVYNKTKCSTLVGHWHQVSSNFDPDMKRREVMTWSQGCLCDRSPEYSRVNRWGWGFAWVESESDGQFQVHNCHLSNEYSVRVA
jgi:predicted phosphodiesterase